MQILYISYDFCLLHLCSRSDHEFHRAAGVDESLEVAVSKRGVATSLVDGVIRLLSSIGTFLVGLGSPAIRLVGVFPHGVLATSLGDITRGAVLFLEGLSHLVGFFVVSTGIQDCIFSPFTLSK